MANCQEYSDLSIIEQRILIGSIIHLLQNDRESYIAISSMVRTAENEGLFEGVKILPESEKKYEYVTMENGQMVIKESDTPTSATFTIKKENYNPPHDLHNESFNELIN